MDKQNAHPPSTRQCQDRGTTASRQQSGKSQRRRQHCQGHKGSLYLTSPPPYNQTRFLAHDPLTVALLLRSLPLVLMLRKWSPSQQDADLPRAVSWLWGPHLCPPAQFRLAVTAAISLQSLAPLGGLSPCDPLKPQGHQ